MKNNNKKFTIIFNNHYELISKNVFRNSREIMALIDKFIDFNSDGLISNKLTERVNWGMKNENALFKLCGVTQEEISNSIAETKLNLESWYQRNRPVYFLCLLLQYFYFEKNKKIERQKVLMLLAIIIYSGRQKKFFPHNTSTAFKNTMEYTINNLSNKYLIKQTGSVYKTIEITLENNNKKYQDLLTSKYDIDMMDYISNLLTRIHNFVKKR